MFEETAKQIAKTFLSGLETYPRWFLPHQGSTPIPGGNAKALKRFDHQEASQYKTPSVGKTANFVTELYAPKAVARKIGIGISPHYSF